MIASALAVLRADDHLSVSAITTYLRCPAQYEHRYVLRTPAAHRPAALAFGSAVHHALAFFYASLRDDTEPEVGDLQAAFDDAWRKELTRSPPVLPDRGERPDAARDRGLGLLATFHEQAPRPHRVIGVEEPFAIELPELDGVRLVGVFDAIVQDADGAYRIIEHKTARRRWTKSRLDFDLQLSAYTLAAPLMGLGLAPVTLQLLLSTKEPAFESVSVVRGPSDHRDLRAILIGVQRSITAGIFFPRRDWHCATCPYSGPCLLAG